MAKGTCSVEGCERAALHRGWCGMHYQRWLKYRDPLMTKMPGKGTRRTLSDGYVRLLLPGHPLSDRRGHVAEHRLVAYEAGLLIDLSMDVHHRDENKQNNDVSNLQVMTRSEHRKLHEAARNAAKTHCPRGHPYDDANTYISPRGSRICRKCRSEAQNARYHAGRS